MTGLAYFHLPKTGGRGISTWIKDQSNDWHMVAGRKACDKYERGSEPWEHPPRFVIGHNVYTFMHPVAEWLTIVRDPAERLFSYYQHHLRREKTLPPFEEWIKTGYPNAPLCTCLHCVCEPEKGIHADRLNPMVWYYATRRALAVEKPDEEARKFLNMCRVYDTTHLDDCVEWMVEKYGFSRRRYEPLNVFGAGSRITAEQRSLVYRVHEGDWELYNWTVGLREGGA